MNATLTSPELTRADRCDRCGAAARVRAKLPSGAELLFCQHHANEHEAKLDRARRRAGGQRKLNCRTRAAGNVGCAGESSVMLGGMSDQAAKPSRHHIRRISTKDPCQKAGTTRSSLSRRKPVFGRRCRLPPLLLGMLGSLAYVAPLFGPDTLPNIVHSAISTAHSLFSPSVVNEIIEPTIRDITAHARGEVVSLGLPDLVVGGIVGDVGIRRFRRRGARPDAAAPPGTTAILRAVSYIVMLVVVVVSAPIGGGGPAQGGRTYSVRPGQRAALRLLPGTDPGLMVGVMLLYRVALPVPLPTHRLIYGAILATAVFVVATLGLRVYLRWITSTGYTYGALSTPIAFLLFALLRRFRDHDRRRTQRRHSGGIPGPTTHAHRLRNWLMSRVRALRKTTESLRIP